MLGGLAITAEQGLYLAQQGDRAGGPVLQDGLPLLQRHVGECGCGGAAGDEHSGSPHRCCARSRLQHEEQPADGDQAVFTI